MVLGWQGCHPVHSYGVSSQALELQLCTSPLEEGLGAAGAPTSIRSRTPDSEEGTLPKPGWPRDVLTPPRAAPPTNFDLTCQNPGLAATDSGGWGRGPCSGLWGWGACGTGGTAYPRGGRARVVWEGLWETLFAFFPRERGPAAERRHLVVAQQRQSVNKGR